MMTVWLVPKTQGLPLPPNDRSATFDLKPILFFHPAKQMPLTCYSFARCLARANAPTSLTQYFERKGIFMFIHIATLYSVQVEAADAFVRSIRAPT